MLLRPLQMLLSSSGEELQISGRTGVASATCTVPQNRVCPPFQRMLQMRQRHTQQQPVRFFVQADTATGGRLPAVTNNPYAQFVMFMESGRRSFWHMAGTAQQIPTRGCRHAQSLQAPRSVPRRQVRAPTPVKRRHFTTYQAIRCSFWHMAGTAQQIPTCGCRHAKTALTK